MMTMSLPAIWTSTGFAMTRGPQRITTPSRRRWPRSGPRPHRRKLLNQCPPLSIQYLRVSGVSFVDMAAFDLNKMLRAQLYKHDTVCWGAAQNGALMEYGQTEASLSSRLPANVAFCPACVSSVQAAAHR